MRKRTSFWIYPLLLMEVFLAFASGCEKDDDKNPYNGKTTAMFNPAVTYGTMSDQDGNIYKTVNIGTQTWMAENLRTTKYNDGTPIPKVENRIEWANLTSDAYCTFNSTNSYDSIATFGNLYNWYTISSGKLAPIGWHVPSDEEWTILTEYLGGSAEAGGKLKEIGTMHWSFPNSGATNEIGFSALPGGSITFGGYFNSMKISGYWWSSTQKNDTLAYNRYINYNDSEFWRFNYFKKGAFSVRCIKN